MMRSFFKEPFVQFVALGFLLFIGNTVWERHVAKSDYMIIVQPGEMERQAVIFASENRRQPTDEDLRALLFAHVEEEVLLREAQRLGLGENDTIIRRRLAQKMRFLIEDTVAPDLPSEADLQKWFEANKQQFIAPEQRSFSHIYLSPEKHGDALQDIATGLLSEVNSSNWKSLGDPFMLNRDYTYIDEKALERLLGSNFANGVFEAEGDQWQGPIESAFGLHLVQINDVRSEAVPELADVRDTIEAAWRETAIRAQNNDRLRDLIEKYKVEVEGEE